MWRCYRHSFTATFILFIVNTFLEKKIEYYKIYEWEKKWKMFIIFHWLLKSFNPCFQMSSPEPLQWLYFIFASFDSRLKGYFKVKWNISCLAIKHDYYNDFKLWLFAGIEALIIPNCKQLSSNSRDDTNCKYIE